MDYKLGARPTQEWMLGATAGEMAFINTANSLLSKGLLCADLQTKLATAVELVKKKKVGSVNVTYDSADLLISLARDLSSLCLTLDNMSAEDPVEDVEAYVQDVTHEPEFSVERDKYAYSVFEVMSHLAAEVSGTSDLMDGCLRHRYRQWLRWRLDYAWDTTASPLLVGYDESLRAAAEAALTASESYLPPEK